MNLKSDQDNNRPANWREIQLGDEVTVSIHPHPLKVFKTNDSTPTGAELKSPTKK